MSSSYDFLDSVMVDLNKAATKEKGNFEDQLPVQFIGECTFKARVVVDKNKKLFNKFKLYNVPIEVTENGETKTRRVMYRCPSLKKDDDPIAPLAEQLDDFRYKGQYLTTFFAEITDITRGQSDKFKTGPCILVASNGRFLTSLNDQIAALATSDEGKQALTDSLDSSKPGLQVIVTNKKGQSGSCTVSFDTYGKKHVIAPEVAEKFDDITKAYCPELGIENDANKMKIIQYYEKLIADKPSLVEGDDPEETKRLASTMKKEKKPANPAVIETNSSSDVLADYEEMMAGLTDA